MFNEAVWRSRIVLIVVVAVALGGACWGVAALAGGPADGSEAANHTVRVSRQDVEKRIDELLRRRQALFRERYELLEQFRETGRVGAHRVRLAKHDALEAELPLCRTARERIAVYERIVANLKVYEGAAERDLLTPPTPGGSEFAPSDDNLQLEAKLLAAQIALERERLAAIEESR